MRVPTQKTVLHLQPFTLLRKFKAISITRSPIFSTTFRALLLFHLCMYRPVPPPTRRSPRPCLIPGRAYFARAQYGAGAALLARSIRAASLYIGALYTIPPTHIALPKPHPLRLPRPALYALAIQRPIPNRLVQMTPCDPCHTLHVRKRPRHLQNAVVRPRTHP